MRNICSRYHLVAVWLAAGVLLGAAAQAAEPQIGDVTFHPPNERYRFFHVQVELAPAERGYRVSESLAGDRPRMFVAMVDGELTQVEPETGRVNRNRNGVIPDGKSAVFVIRMPWVAGESYRVQLRGAWDGDGEAFEASTTADAPEPGGFPYPGWMEHRLLVLEETAGIARENEPYVLFLSDEGGRVRNWGNELRVARYDFATGAAAEIPSQVLSSKRRRDTPELQAEYTTCEAAFLVDVPAHGTAAYLIVYGNPAAEMPVYPTDLQVTIDEDGATWIENAYYAVKLDQPSGQIKGIRAKRFGAGEDRGFGLGPEERYALHYNPDVWVRNRRWTHTHGWNPPPNEQTEAGPVAVVTRRWGPLPRASEVEVEVVYHFFRETPVILVESTMDITHDLVVNALRNEEVVFSPVDRVDRVAWRGHDGRVAYQPFAQGEGLTPGLVALLPPDAPYVAGIREANELGFASIRLSQHAGGRAEDPPVIASSKTVVADYGWNFRYWSRSLAYPWGDHVPDHPIVLNAGTYYGEKSAFVIFPLGEGRRPAQRMAYVDALYEQLSHPLWVKHQGAGPW